MGLLQDWQAIAFNEKADRGQLQNFWSRYFAIEKSVYEKLLSNPDEAVEGTVKELAERFEIEVMAPEILQLTPVCFFIKGNCLPIL